MCGDKKKFLAPLGLGFAIGMANAICMLILGLSGAIWGYALPAIQLVATLYPGFAATYMGAFIGALWGFLDGFIFGLLVALFYNCCSCCCPRVCGKRCEGCSSKDCVCKDRTLPK